MHTRKSPPTETICCLLCTLVLLFGSMASVTYAAEIKTVKNNLDIMFIMDHSGSMNTNDKEKVAPEMVKAFVDTVHSENVRVGFVAYNDGIVSSSAPVPVATAEERTALKSALGEARYSGNTDIGLALKYACELSGEEPGRRRMFVLISDGESDLGGSATGRTLEDSVNDLEYAASVCEEAAIPIYTVAFGSFGGSREVLEHIAGRTGGQSYTAQNPELLIEVLYGILNNNLAYKIQQLSAGRYASGNQEISCTLNESYLSEIVVLLISPQKIGTTSIQYGDIQIPMTGTNYYAVGKIYGKEINKTIKELTIHTDTTDGLQVKVYVIGYRNLEPILNLEPVVACKDNIPYQIYFRDKDGNLIQDEAFYQKFQWTQNLSEQHPAEVKDGYLQGELPAMAPGQYTLEGQLSDELGSYQFQTSLTLLNTPPAGAMPTVKTTTLSKPTVLNLDDFFHDAEGDVLQYAIIAAPGTDRILSASLAASQLTVAPLKAGTGVLEIQVSDGDSMISSLAVIQVIPWWQVYWQVYWQVILLAAFVTGVIIWRLSQRPKAEPRTIADIRSPHRFNGRLDLYFTLLPEAAGEIPPLVFPMHKVRGSKIRLGDLLQDYPEEAAKLGLDQIYLIADEERKMILYHMSDSTIMIGNSIACKQIRYSVSFGDVLYITTADGTYDLELHYISVIQ